MASALSIMTQFKGFVMKGGFMLILLIRHADVLGRYALEQGTCPRLISCDPCRQSDSLSLSPSPVHTSSVCFEKYIQ